jgi:hypothetical protein
MAKNRYYWHRDLGYTQFGKVWGIALREVEGHYEAEREDVNLWPFKDAPQWMQIESIGKIPDLFDELIQRTEETTQKLRNKTLEARALADALSRAVEDDGFLCAEG